MPSEAYIRLFRNAWDAANDARKWADCMLKLQVRLAEHPVSPAICTDPWLRKDNHILMCRIVGYVEQHSSAVGDEEDQPCRADEANEDPAGVRG